jgi:hypothetical protein
MSSDYFLALTDHYRRVRARLNGTPPPVPLALAATEHALIVAFAPPAPEPEPEPPPPPPPPPPDPTLGLVCGPDTRRLIRDVLAPHGLTWADVAGRNAKARYVRARTDIYVALRERGWSYPKIGALVGGRDHTSVINSVQRHYRREDSI